MTEWVADQHYTELAAADPEQICRHQRAIYDPAAKTYCMTIWGDQYLIDPHRKQAHPKASGVRIQDFFPVFIVYFLLYGQDNKPGREWISEKDLPGGAGFFRGPHLVPTALISDTFGNDLEHFAKTCRECGGVPLELADAAFSFQITPEIPVAVLYWQGDEDFPAEAKLLFDRSMTNYLPLDIVFALAVEVCDRLHRSGKG